MYPYDQIAITATLGYMSSPAWGPPMLKLLNIWNFLFRHDTRKPVEKWAQHNAHKVSADELIAAGVIRSFASDFKHWKFEGEFNQRHRHSANFRSTSLQYRRPTKKNIDVVFIFSKTDVGDTYSTIYKYKVVGCEVNGVRVSDKAFKQIYTAWNNMVVQVKATEEAAAEALKRTKENEAKWNLAEQLLGMKRDGLGALVPVKTVNGEDA